jgi:hypothetical protein
VTSTTKYSNCTQSASDSHPLTSLFSFGFQFLHAHTLSFARSTGQGYSSSKQTRAISTANRWSIMQKLAARSLPIVYTSTFINIMDIDYIYTGIAVITISLAKMRDVWRG